MRTNHPKILSSVIHENAQWRYSRFARTGLQSAGSISLYILPFAFHLQFSEETAIQLPLMLKGAVVAAGDLKVAARVGERAFLDVLDPSAVDAKQRTVFGLAHGGAEVAADALAAIVLRRRELGCHH